LHAIFRNPNKQQLLQFVVENSILPDDLLLGVQNQQRTKAIGEFEEMLQSDAREHETGNAGFQKIIGYLAASSCAS
jgi:hypothetical protein